MIAPVENSEFDVIVVGSGMGGLAAASILASVGKRRVLVVESHFKLGGFLHSFRRKNYVWDPGVHYIGDMESGSLTRQCMDLVTGGEVEWEKMHDDFERYLFPDETFRVPSCPKRYEERLMERFPAEAKGIRRYFRDVKAIQGWSHRWFFSKQFPEPFAGMISWTSKLAKKNTQAYLDELFEDPLLKSVLTGQWPDYGSKPEESAFGVHATVAADFHTGGYYPVGGSQKIADGAAKVIEDAGGKCLVNHPVKRILIKDNKACGVVVETKGQEKEYFAPCVISNAGVETTFTKLVAPEYAQAERARVGNSQPGTSAIILFLGLKDDPTKHGFENCNYWLFNSNDHNDHLRQHGVEGGFVSFGSVRNPGQAPHTGQIVTFSREEDWSQFQNTIWKKRGEAYEAAKQEFAENLLDFAESRMPGLKELVAYQELSTPLTFQSFTGHPRGQIYGNACTEKRIGECSWSIGTSVKQLYLTGTDITIPGVNSALMVGVMTAGKLLGWFGMPRILTRAFTQKSKRPTVSAN